ncbi:GyrI-like domain-containing protein [Bacillus sp. T3]|uniref:GyrI-like domain-containing protein n=1 Tax=Bacillus sp. T3 TaxID=467262 RepID=UPI00298167BF|nr:GyrI-like domain-containing protein [Bacillus sp. T3]
MNDSCQIQEQLVQPVVSIRMKTSVDQLPMVIGQSYGEIMKYLSEKGEAVAGIPFVAYYNMDMQNLDVEIGMPVAHPIAGRGRVQPSEIPSGKYASCTHIGPYPEVGKAYDRLSEFVMENKEVPTGVAYEYYLNSPEEVPESELVTKVAFRLN